MSTPASYPPSSASMVPAAVQPHRRRRSILVALSAWLIVGLMVSGSVLAGTTPMRWHRLNVHSEPAEHERFGCIPGDVWRCRYDKLPEPTLALMWDQTHGMFSGTDTTSDWVCPAWFPGAACDAADTVVSGEATFIPPRHGEAEVVDQQLLVSDDGRLWIYWTDLFVCPWYATFAEALESESSCTFAP